MLERYGSRHGSGETADGTTRKRVVPCILLLPPTCSLHMQIGTLTVGVLTRLSSLAIQDTYVLYSVPKT